MASKIPPPGTMAVTDYRDLVRELKKVDLLKPMRKEIRNDSKPLLKQIKSEIPSDRPLSHMSPDINKIGRLAWGRGVAAKKVELKQGAPKRGSKAESLIRFVIPSAMTVVADMAGKSGKYVNKRPLAKGNGAYAMMVESGKYKGQMGYKYTYRNGKVSGRVHAIRGQGRRMIENLTAKYAPASRFAYKGAEAGLVQTRAKVYITVKRYVNEVNNRLDS
jgi:hypothetical protein